MPQNSLTALYVAMNWINTDECSEIMAYATEQLIEVDRFVCGHELD